MDTIFLVITNILFFFEEASDWFFNKEIDELMRIFWVFLFLEIPRYFFTDIVVFIQALRQNYYFKYVAPRTLFKEPPTVSVIMPALNEELLIYDAIQSLIAQDYPQLEIIVIDDHSSDATPDICQEFSKKGQINYFRFNERQGKSAALNYGIKVSTGDFLMFIDTDTSFDRLAIFNIVQYFQDDEVGAVGGNFRIRNDDVNFLTRFVAIEYFLSMSMGWRFKGLMGIINCVPGWFGMYRRNVVESVGLFEPGPGNDSDITIRTRKLKQKIVFAPDAISLTDTPVEWHDWVKQRMRWSRNLVKYRLRRHRDVFNVRSENFTFSNFWAFFDNIFFLMVMPFAWVIYIVDLSMNYLDVMLLILFVNICLHLILRLAQFSIAVSLSERKSLPLKLMPYLFFYGFYMIFYKIVRVIAYVQELVFRASYQDSFAPEKIRKKMIRY